MASQAVAVLHREEIIRQVAQGRMLKHVAQQLGVTPSAISQVIKDDPEYRQARELGAEVRLEEQFEAITNAEDQAATSRAREGFRAATWFAEREFPHRWGQKVEHSVTLSLSDALQAVADRRQRERERTLDVVPETIVQPQQGEVTQIITE